MSKSPADTPWRPPTIVVGRVGRPHGLDGAVYLEGHGGAVSLRSGLAVTWGEAGGDRRAPGHRSHPIVRFDIAADRDAVEALRGRRSRCPPSALPEPDPTTTCTST